MKSVTKTTDTAVRETQPKNWQPLGTRFITLYGDDVDVRTKVMIEKLLSGCSLLPQVIDARALSAEQAVRQVTAELPGDGHLLICAHGQNRKVNDHHTHYIGLPHDRLPCIATESLVKMVVDHLGIEPTRVDQPGKGLPFIYFLSCHSGALRRQLSPDSELWKRANLLMFAGSHYNNMLSSSNSVAGVIAYIDYCQRNRLDVDPLKLFFFAGMHRGDCLTLMGGKLSAPLVWHAPKSGQDQGRIDNLSGSPKDKQRFEQAVASMRPAEYRLLPAASLTEVLCNRITRDDADRLRELLVAHPELRDMPTKSGLLPLGFAAEALAGQCVLALLEAGADPNALDTDGDLALIESVRYSTTRVDVVQTLLSHGADPNLRDPKGATALIYACNEGHMDAVRVLLAYGANLALQRKDGETAMTLACRNGHEDVIQSLLVHGADANMRYPNKRTALMAACINGHSKAARVLIEARATLDLQDDEGLTALMWAVGQPEPSSLRLLLAHEANPDLQSHHGVTALMYAAGRRDTQALQLLLKAKADPDLQDNGGNTALMIACLQGNIAAMRALLKESANPDLQNKDGVTALMDAVDQPGTAALELLLGEGARVDLFTNDGSSCLSIAARKNRPDVLRLLISFGAGTTAGLNQKLIDEAYTLGHHEVTTMLQTALDHFNAMQ